MNRVEPDGKNRRFKHNKKHNYHQSLIYPKDHYVPNEINKTIRLQGYLEWYWRHDQKGKQVMAKRRQRMKDRSVVGTEEKFEDQVKQSLSIFKKELYDVKR